MDTTTEKLAAALRALLAGPARSVPRNRKTRLAESNARAALAEYDAQPVRPGIVLHVEGGIVQDVIANCEVDVFIIDYDNDGEEEDKVCEIDQGEGAPAYALAGFLPVETTPDYVQGRFAKYRATNGEAC